MKKIKLSQFIGRQLARLKAGQSYYLIFMGTITALSTFSFAFQLNLWIILMLFPIALISVLFIGYFMDKKDIITIDHQKTIEMTHRYLTTLDFKNNEFRILMMECMFEGFKSLQENKPLNPDILKEKYKKFLNKWNPP